MDRLEPISLPWAQGVGRSNRPAPTKEFSILRVVLDFATEMLTWIEK